jgi:hypothetical protein
MEAMPVFCKGKTVHNWENPRKPMQVVYKGIVSDSGGFWRGIYLISSYWYPQFYAISARYFSISLKGVSIVVEVQESYNVDCPDYLPLIW